MEYSIAFDNDLNFLVESGFPLLDEDKLAQANDDFQKYIESHCILKGEVDRLTLENKILKENMEKYTSEAVKVCEYLRSEARKWERAYNTERCLRIGGSLENQLLHKKLKK